MWDIYKLTLQAASVMKRRDQHIMVSQTVTNNLWLTKNCVKVVYILTFTITAQAGEEDGRSKKHILHIYILAKQPK